MLGAVEEGQWRNETLTLNIGETLLLYTDGVTDTVGADERFGEERLHDLAARCSGQPASEMVACLDEGLNAFQVGAQADDTAALALRLVGVPGRRDEQPSAQGRSSA